MADTNLPVVQTPDPAGPTKPDTPPVAVAARPKPAAVKPRVAKVAEMLLVTVDPATNNGHDAAPALVTSVDKDGLVHVLVYRESATPPVLYGGIAVFADRATLDQLERDDPDQRPAFAAYFA